MNEMEPSYRNEMYVERLDGDRMVVMLDPEASVRPVAGRSYMAVLVEVDATEKPRGRMVWPSQRAAGLCADERFAEYTRACTKGLVSPREFIMAHCKIKSRSDLDRDAAAESRYRGLYAQFMEWTKQPRNSQAARNLEEGVRVRGEFRKIAAFKAG